MCKRAYDPVQSCTEQCAITELTATQDGSVTRYIGLLTNTDHNADVTHLPLFLKIRSHKSMLSQAANHRLHRRPSLAPPGLHHSFMSRNDVTNHRIAIDHAICFVA